ncbi:MAG: DUF3253 domain-containing protein [Acidovorax sp.]
MDAQHIEQAILALLAKRAPGKTICPSEVARMLAAGTGPAQWRLLMPAVRNAANRLSAAGRLQVTQRGSPVCAASAVGPIRLGHPGVLSCKSVEERNLPKSLTGQAQSTAMPDGMASICNDAWRRLSGD